MIKKFYFLGLGISTGQSITGPAGASEWIRDYFSILKKVGIEFLDQGTIYEETSEYQKIFSENELGKIDWRPYFKAYQKIRSLYVKGSHHPILNWGGDHSVALATVAAFCEQYKNGYVLWIDAHADINLPEHSMSGHAHGMPLSFLLNLRGIAQRSFPWIKTYLNPERLIYVGLRDLDPFEVQTLKDLKIKFYTASDVKRRGMRGISEEILNRCQDAPLHISFDIDSVSPEFAAATGLHVPQGLTPIDLNILGTHISKKSNIVSMDVVEINPLIGKQEDVFNTILIAINFIKSIFCPQGGAYDGYRRANQTYNPAVLEPRSQI